MHTNMRQHSPKSPAAGAANRAALGEPLLAVRNIGISFGGIVALDGVSFDLSEGHILGLIGPNGAGKTTLFNCLSRLYTPTAGDILFEGQSILGKPRASDRRHRHRPHLPEPRPVPRHDACSTTCAIGGHSQSRSDFFSDALRLPGCGAQEKALAAERAGTDRLSRSRDVAAPSRRRPAVRHAETRRAGARAGGAAQATVARRARQRPQPSKRSTNSARCSASIRDDRQSPCFWSSIT